MTSRFSLYLDLLRFSAAVAVLLSHWAYPRFSGGDFIFLREINIGSDAVVMFFVLSGFVVTYAGLERDKELKCFLFKRATRLYSVAIPALFLTLFLDQLGSWLHPVAYNDWWYQWPSTITFLTYGLTFSSEWSGQGFRMGTNGPFWSLSYEAAYYIGFAIMVYLNGWKRIAGLFLGVLLFGVKVLLLLPCWLLGVALYFILKNPPKLSLFTTTVLILVPPLIYLSFVAIGLAPVLKSVSYYFLVPAEMRQELRFSDEFLWNWIIGLLMLAHMLGIALWAKHCQKQIKEEHIQPVRWLAGATFSIYLVHYPVMQFLSATLPHNPTKASDQWLLLALTVILTFIFAEIFERPLLKYRRTITKFLRSAYRIYRSAKSKH